MALVGACASAQQKGDMAVGLNLGVAPILQKGANTTNFGIGAKFQYNVTNPIRLEADVDYWFKSKVWDIFDFSVNAHYLFDCGEKFAFYPIIGIGYGHISIGGSNSSDYNGNYDDDDNDKGGSASRFLFNVGIGAQYNLTSKIAVGAEVKYQYMKDFNRLPITIGVTYKF